LKHVSRDDLAKHLDKSAKRYAEDVVHEGMTGPLEAHRFGRDPKALRSFPKTALQTNPLVGRMAAEHYAADQGLVASGDTKGELFHA
jgi:hypothetical protein